MTRKILAVAALLLLASVAGCATAYPGKPAQLAGAPVDGAPAIKPPVWIEASDTRIPIEAIPWCDDQRGWSSVYPCKWDSRVRPVSGWDAQAAPVAVFVRRSVGCGLLVGRVKTSEDNSVAWACYYAPGT